MLWLIAYAWAIYRGNSDRVKSSSEAVVRVREASFAVEAHFILEHARIATFLPDTDAFEEGATEAILFINYHIICPILLSLVTLGKTLHAEVHKVRCIDR